MATPDEKDNKIPDDESFIRDLDTHFPLSGNETDDDLEEEEDTADEDTGEFYDDDLDKEFPLSGGETSKD